MNHESKLNNEALVEEGQALEKQLKHKEAAVKYRQAAEADSDSGAFYLGVLYKNGLGVEQDDKEAVKWYKQSEAAGHSSARVNLGWMFENGRGVAKSLYQAELLYKRAKNHPTALYNLGDICLGKKDYMEASRWYLKAHKKDKKYASPCYKLAILYSKGFGLQKSMESAWIWYTHAANCGSKEAISLVKRRSQLLKAIDQDDYSASDLFTKELLLSPQQESSKSNIYRLIAAKGRLDKIPEDALNRTIVENTDSKGQNLLHTAAQNKQLHKFPSQYLTPALLNQKNNSAESVIDIALRQGQSDAIPLSILWENSDYVFSEIQKSIVTNNISNIPDDFDWTKRYSVGCTPLHLLAGGRQIKLIPKDQLFASNLLLKDKHGSSVVDILYQKNCILDIPKSLRFLSSDFTYQYLANAIKNNHKIETPDYVILQHYTEKSIPGDITGNTILHLACRYGSIEILPIESITSNGLSTTNAKQESPLHIAAKHQNLHIIPKQFLTKDKLTIVAADGCDVITMAYENGCITSIPATLRCLCEEYHRELLEQVITEKTTKFLPEPHDWLRKFSDGSTPLHYLASAGLIKLAPLSDLPQSIFNLKNADKKDVVELAYGSRTIDDIPKKIRLLSKEYIHAAITHAIKTEDYSDIHLFSPETLQLKPHTNQSDGSYCHWIARLGCLSKLPSKSLDNNTITYKDQMGKNPIHQAIEAGHFGSIPEPYRSDLSLLDNTDQSGRSCFHYASTIENFGGLPGNLFTLEALLSLISHGRNLADHIEEHGNTHLLPENLQYCSKEKGIKVIQEIFQNDFLLAKTHHAQKWFHIIPDEEFTELRNLFVQNWIATNILDKEGKPLLLDIEQTETVAESGTHIQVVARAGSGKTRCLVCRIIFQIRHCKIKPSSILALAFNSKAAAEIRERLTEAKLTPHEMPHVMTFHALAWRIVNPTETILYDPDGADEKKLLSQTIDQIIKRSLRQGDTQEALQQLIRIQWEKSLEAMLSEGFHLSIEAAIELKEKVHDKALNGRTVENSHHKWIYNFLLSHNLIPSYKKAVRYYGGDVYRPPFLLNYDDQSKPLIIEFTNSAEIENKAQINFYQSAKKKDYQIIILSFADDTPRKDIISVLKEDLVKLDIPFKRLSKEQVWELIKKKTIEQFTSSIQTFIARCKKALMGPTELEKAIRDYSNPSELQILFWNESLNILQQYEEVLINNNQTDFDSLLLSAAKKIKLGHTRFTSNGDYGDIKNLDHILIDEFQDFSHLFNELRKSILTQAQSLNFFCVGDDWQAINRFAGSDIQYFKEFSTNFQPSEVIELTTNYRSPEKVVDEGNQVMDGHGSPSRANKKEAGEIYRCHLAEIENLSSEEKIIHQKFGMIGCYIMRLSQAHGMPLESLRNTRINPDKNRKVAFLSRNRKMFTPNGIKTLSWWQKELRKHLPPENREQLEFSTTHGYKGQEADTIILLEPENYPLVHQDSLFNTIFKETLEDIEMDERRLFYVGVTRAEKKLIYLTLDHEKVCQFTDHIDSLPEIEIQSVSPHLLTGDLALIVVYNDSSVTSIENEGTKPIKEKIMSSGFSYQKKAVNGIKYSYIHHVSEEQVATSKSLLTLLGTFSWVNHIEKVKIDVTTETLTYSYFLNQGHFKRLDAKLTDEQKEELQLLEETVGSTLPPILEMLHLDLKQEWPISGYEGGDQGLLEIAWPDDKLGLYLPGDDVGIFRKKGWRLIELSPENKSMWEVMILQAFDKKPSVRILNQGILKLYHFTDHSNLDSIKQHGIYSHKELNNREIPCTSGGNAISLELDKQSDLHDYVHLCLLPHHPMAHQAEERGTIEKAVYIPIDPTVLDLPEVKACLGVSVSKNATIIDIDSALNQINWDAWKADWANHDLTGLENEEDNSLHKFEFLVPRHIAAKYFTQIQGDPSYIYI